MTEEIKEQIQVLGLSKEYDAVIFKVGTGNLPPKAANDYFNRIKDEILKEAVPILGNRVIVVHKSIDTEIIPKSEIRKLS